MVVRVPLYEYQCQPHNHRFEVRQAFGDEPLQTCPECGGAIRRVIHPVGIVFKGSGFYATDSRTTNSESKPASSTPAETKTADKTESKAETKSHSGAAAEPK